MCDTSKKVVIVGAGIAGVSALQLLHAEGFKNVTVLEAKSYIGGRICTQPYGARNLEIGAQWIHGQRGNPVFALAKKHGFAKSNLGLVGKLKTALSASSDDEDDEGHFYDSSGERIRQDFVEQILHKINKIYQAAESDSHKSAASESDSVGELVEKRFSAHVDGCKSSDKDKQWMRGLLRWQNCLYKTDNSCSSMHDVSLAAWGEYEDCDGNPYVPLKQGYISLLEKAVLDGIPSDVIRLNAPVQCIQWQLNGNNNEKSSQQESTSHPANVKLSTGEIIEADHVIVTCSLGVLKRHASSMFVPVLPSDKLGAIERLSFGTVNKIYLEFKHAFWDKDCAGIQLVWLPEDGFVLDSAAGSDSSQSDPWWKEIHGFEVVEFHDNLLCGWISGRYAEVMETLSDDVIIDVCYELLRRFTRSRSITRPHRLTRSSWHSEPYTLGSYTHVLAGNQTADFDLLAQALPSAQNPVLCFAGEATHRTWYASTHGAYASGQREARRIIDYNTK